MQTETWLHEGQVESLREELTMGSGLNIMGRNRKQGQNGVAYGGVAFVWKESAGVFKEVKIKNKEEFEVLVAAGSLRGLSRKLAVVACYIPPNYTKARGSGPLPLTSLKE